MKLRTMLILAVVVVAGYLIYASVVGFARPVPDINQPDDVPVDVPELSPEPTAYVTFTISGEVSVQGTTRLIGTITDLKASVSDYVSPQQGRVYETDKLSLWPWPFNPPDLPVDEMYVAQYWVTLTVERVLSVPWYSDKTTFETSTQYDIQTGRLFIWEKGTYTVKADLYGSYDSRSVEWSGLLTTKSVNFEVNV